MKACRISLVIKDGKSLFAWPPLYVSEDFFKTCVCSNIVTYHAEDGSGVGSAIIAGTTPVTSRHHSPHSHFFLHSSYDEDQKR